MRFVDRPREPRRRWTILTPTDIGRVARAFGELLEAETDAYERAWLEQARVVFLTVIGAGLRRGELLGLRWRDVALADPDGATLRVRETFVRNEIETPKSEAGRGRSRSPACSPTSSSSIAAGPRSLATTRGSSAIR